MNTRDDDLPPVEPGTEPDDIVIDGVGYRVDDHGRDSDRDGEQAVDYVNIDDEEASRPRTWLRVGVWLLSIFILIVFITLPILRIVIWADDSPDPGSAAREARGFVATQFTSDALESRSVSAAQRWVQPELAETVDDIVGRLQATPSAQIAGSRARVARAACLEPAPDNAECFHAWLARAGQPELIRVELLIGIVDGTATVIGLQTIASI